MFEELDDLFEEKNTIIEEEHFEKDYDTDTTKNNKKITNYSNGKKKKKGIDLFKDNVDPKPIDTEKLKYNNVFTIAVADDDITIDEKTTKVLETIFKKLSEKGYRVRLFCSGIKPILTLVKKYFDNDKIVIVVPWKKFCKLENMKVWTPSDANIEAAAMYFKNFDNLPTSIKSINAAYVTVLTGLYNNDGLRFALIIDPYSDAKKIDFKKSKGTSNLLWAIKSVKDISIPVFNLLKENDIKNLIEIVKQ